MGSRLVPVNSKPSAHYYLICDGCGFEVNLITCLELPGYKNENNWRTVFNNNYPSVGTGGKVKEYCNLCAAAFGYFKDEGENFYECKAV